MSSWWACAPAESFAIEERLRFTVRAEASDDVRVARVRFMVDGMVVAEDFRAPFEAQVVRGRRR